MARDSLPEKGKKFWTIGDERDDPVQQLTSGANTEHDEQLLKDGRVFDTKAEAEAEKAKRFPPDRQKP